MHVTNVANENGNGNAETVLATIFLWNGETQNRTEIYEFALYILKKYTFF